MKRIYILALAAVVAGGVYYFNTPKPIVLVDMPAPTGPATVAEVPADWSIARAARQDRKVEYLKQHEIAFDWFSEFPFSQVDGIPMVLLRLLPKVAPEIWGEPKEFGKSFGLFKRTDGATLPLPVGIGFSGMDPKSDGAVDYTSFTCAACHIGRVDQGDGTLHSIVGGVNAEFNIAKFFVDTKKTLDKLSGAAAGDDRSKVITRAFEQALKEVSASDANYFYGNYAYDGQRFDADYEAAQISVFMENSDTLTSAFVDYIDSFISAYSVYMDKTYNGYQKTMLAGLPGMADATGVSSSHGYETLEVNFFGRLFANDVLPDNPGLTDFMVVWEQDARAAEWDADGELLINGGGQYNGNIPIPIYRNLAASMTLGLKQTDLRVAAFTQELLGGLPADAYPFDVDVEMAEKGRRLFSANCADCHQSNNGKVYRNMGTDPSRSLVINELLVKGARQEYLAICNPKTQIVMYGKQVSPCESFDGRPITDEAIFRPLGQQAGGYNATALRGVWAVAPYLHTGAVPTLYHLLMPSERPTRFVKGALQYDKDYVGFAWKEGGEGGYLFDTSAFHAITNTGHDRDIIEDGKSYKLDWSDDVAGAMAIIEYLKTL